MKCLALYASDREGRVAVCVLHEGHDGRCMTKDLDDAEIDVLVEEQEWRKRDRDYWRARDLRARENAQHELAVTAGREGLWLRAFPTALPLNGVGRFYLWAREVALDLGAHLEAAAREGGEFASW